MEVVSAVRCVGCLAVVEDGEAFLTLSCGHAVHTGLRMRAADASFFQYGQEFACVAAAAQQQQNHHLDANLEDAHGELACPRCWTALGAMETWRVLPDRAHYLAYGATRASTLAIRQAVAKLILAWSPQNAARFALKTDALPAPLSSPAVPPNAKLRGMDKFLALFDFYCAHQVPTMGDILTEAMLDADLREKDLAVAMDMIDKLVSGRLDELQNKDKKAKLGSGGGGVGYGGVAGEYVAVDVDSVAFTQKKRDEEIAAAMNDLALAVKTGKNLGAPTEALFRNEGGPLTALTEILWNGNVNDIMARITLYRSVLNLLVQVSTKQFLSPLIFSSATLRSGPAKWSAAAASSLAKSRDTTTKAGPSSSIAHHQQPASGRCLADSLRDFVFVFRSLRVSAPSSSSSAAASSTDNPLLQLAEQALGANETMFASLPHEAATTEEDAMQTALAICNAIPRAPQSQISDAYRRVLGKEAFRFWDIVNAGTPHGFRSTFGGGSESAGSSSATAAPLMPRERQRVLMNTVLTLKSSCPVEWSSSVFCTVDETRYDVLTVLITGPEGTPYDSGCFLFDFHLPPDFPQAPPLGLFMTTGEGKFRFNPNLYANGKICLSLLGTWAGPKWDPQSSTLLQLFISIQSLILCAQPYFNEPAYEAMQNNEVGRMQGNAYNETIRMGTAQFAMLEMLRNPPKPFENIIRTHFKLKKTAILAQLDAWNKEAKKPSCKLNGIIEKLTPLLDGAGPPPPSPPEKRSEDSDNGASHSGRERSPRVAGNVEENLHLIALAQSHEDAGFMFDDVLGDE